MYYFKSPLDGLQRLSFYTLSNQYPLIILNQSARRCIGVLAP